MKLQLHHLLRFILFAAVVLFSSDVRAQSVTTGVPASPSSGSGNTWLTFSIENTNGSPVAVTDIDMYRSSTSNGNTYTLLYSSTSLSGPVNLATGWTSITSVVLSNVTTTAIHPTFAGMQFIIPANTAYRFAVQTSGSSFNYGGAATTPNSATNAGVTIGSGSYQISGANVGYWGSTTPRFWAGTVYFLPVAPCTAPPTAGTATVSNLIPCLGQSVNLGLTGNSFGTGQAFQWETTTNLSGAWAPEGSANPAPSITVTPAAVGNTYYRCAVSCGASTVYSDTVTLNVPALFPGGTYTINSAVVTGGSNFQSFTDAALAIGCGISGPIVLNVLAGSGPYNEQVTFPATIGSNSTNTVTINGNNCTITSMGGASSYATMSLDGADFITVNDLNITAAASVNNFALHLGNQANNNAFNNCTITASTGALNTTSACVIMSGSRTSYSTGGQNGSHNRFFSCDLSGGYMGFSFYSTVATPDTSNDIVDCTIREFAVYGSYNIYQNSDTITGNLFERPTRPDVSTGYGIMLSTGCGNSFVSKNTVRNLFGGVVGSPNTAYAIYCSGDGATGFENKIFNNLIYDIRNNGTVGGLYLTGADYIQAYNNTIVLDYPASNSGTSYGIYSSGTLGGIDIQNNNISIVRGGFGKKYGMYFSGAGSKISNYNNIYVNAPAAVGFTGYFSADIATLAAWQAANGGVWDAQSTEADPMFTNAPTYIPGNSLLDNTGTPLPPVTDDILGTLRDLLTPDIGAYEYVVPACSGTPIAGTATVNDTLLCLNGPGTLSLTGYSSGAGTSIQWEESTTSTGPWTSVATGGTNSTYNFTFTTDMFYRATVTCGATPVSSNVIAVTAKPFFSCYCSPLTGATIHTCCGNYVSNVTISGTTMNNSTTTTGSGYYTQYDTSVATQRADLLQGVTYLFQVTNTYTGLGYGADIWIDFDQSGTFDAAEFLPMGITPTGNLLDSNITIPTGIATGLTGMRVRAYYSTTGSVYGATNACQNNGSGYETEDYVVNILPAPTCLPPYLLTMTNPTTTSMDLGWTSAAPQWEVEYSTGNTFTLGTGTRVGPAGLTNPYPLSGLQPATQYSFFVRDICSPGDSSMWSGRGVFTTVYPPPPNDDCLNAIDISNGLDTSGYVINGTQSLAPCDAGTTTADDVWYVFTTGASTTAIMDSVNTTNTGADVVVQAFSGVCGSLVPMVPVAGTTFNATTGCTDGPAAGVEWANYNVTPNTTYYIRVYTYGTTVPGTFSIQVVPTTPLSIKLDKITATNTGASNRIDWNTLSEERTDRFELQRGADGKNFETINIMNANGQASRYTYMDNTPIQGNNYYRLLLKDVNGKEAYSETVKAFVKTTVFTVEAFPNPVSQDMTVRVNGGQRSGATVQVTDVTGKVMKTIRMNSSQEKINMSGLADGIYLIKYSDSNNTRTIRVSKQ